MILVFGGTTEGRMVCRVLDESGHTYYYSTKGASQEIELVHGIRLSGAMTEELMQSVIQENEIHLVVDAAHPFASELHRTIGRVTEALGIPVIRYERRYPALDPRIIVCESYEEMIDRLLAQPAHRLLALTGTNTIAPMRRFWEQRESFFRILDRDDSRRVAEQSGFPIDHLCYFVEGGDQALFDKIKPDAVTTKDSGESGFFLEKIAPALSAGIPVYMLTRPKLPRHYQTVNGPIGLRKLIERNLPEFFALKTGFTTGSTATVATVAALQALLGLGEAQHWAEIELPSGERVSLPIERVEPTANGFRAYAKKDSGDDPDVTSGTLIASEVSYNDLGVVRFLQGEGVGVVTLPGIGIPVGEPAINATPRSMMRKEVERLLKSKTQGIDIRISVPEGRVLAQKTFNPRLGIEGGISIIGTSGVVRPFSSEAFVASIVRQVEVAQALGADTIVINSGAKSENYLKRAFANLPSQCFVQYGNFIGETLQKLSDCQIPNIYMGIMLGKAVKLAEGNTDTHSKKVVMNKSFLRQMAGESGCSEEGLACIDRITLARELWTELSSEDSDRFMMYLLETCHKVSAKLVPQSRLTLLLINDEGAIRHIYPLEAKKKLNL